LGFVQSNALAVAWFQRAANSGYALSAFTLGKLFETGNKRKLADWKQKAVMSKLVGK
jgi:TPR repeat protein